MVFSQEQSSKFEKMHNRSYSIGFIQEKIIILKVQPHRGQWMNTASIHTRKMYS